MTVHVTIHGVGGWAALAGLAAIAILTPLACWFDGRNTGRHQEWMRHHQNPGGHQ